MKQREIRFRAWFNGKMHDDAYINHYTLRHWIDSIKCPVMQFTGLKDKHGKEIFEGDFFKCAVIVNKSLHGEYSYHQFEIKNGCVITSYLISEKGAILPPGYLACPFWDKFDVDTKYILFRDDIILHDCEIIGNIFEHPNLIQSNND